MVHEQPLEPLLPGFLCASPAMMRVVEQIQRLAADHPDETCAAPLSFRAPFPLELFDLLRLPVGEHFREHTLDANLARNRLRGALVVAGHHHDLKPHPLKRAHGLD